MEQPEPVTALWLGRIGYREAWDVQRRRTPGLPWPYGNDTTHAVEERDANAPHCCPKENDCAPWSEVYLKTVPVATFHPVGNRVVENRHVGSESSIIVAWNARRDATAPKSGPVGIQTTVRNRYPPPSELRVDRLHELMEVADDDFIWTQEFVIAGHTSSRC